MPSSLKVENSRWVQSNRIKDGIYIDDDHILFGYFKEGDKHKTTPAVLDKRTGIITSFPYEEYIRHLSDYQQYRQEFMQLNGFEVPNINYEQPVDVAELLKLKP